MIFKWNLTIVFVWVDWNIVVDHRQKFDRHVKKMFIHSTIYKQIELRTGDPEGGHFISVIVCYQRFHCDLGILYFDSRVISNGIQQCIDAVVPDNCDLLEMNRCDVDEYRSMNGRSIPNDYFLHGECVCMDWTDQLHHKNSQRSVTEAASIEHSLEVLPDNKN